MQAFLLVLCATIVTQAHAQQSDADKAQDEVKLSDPTNLAYTSSANLASVSAMLAKSRKDVQAMIAARTDSIVEWERATVTAANSVNRDISVYENTRSTELATSLKAMIAAGDLAFAKPAALAASEAELRASIKAATTLQESTTEKIDAAAKKLAALAKESSRGTFALEFVKFIQDTKMEVRKLEAKADQEASTAAKQSSSLADEQKKKLTGMAEDKAKPTGGA